MASIGISKPDPWSPRLIALVYRSPCLTSRTHLCRSAGEDQRRLLLWHAPVTAAVARDARRVRRFLHLLTKQHTCTPGTWKTCYFSRSQHPFSFLQICGHRIAPTTIRSIARHGVTSSSECISRSCTALINWRSVCWTFGTMSWTRASLMMQLTSGVRVFERVCGQKADNRCKLDNSIVCRTVWRDMFRFIKRDICNLSQSWTLIFHSECGNILWVWWAILHGFCLHLLLFPTVRNFQNRLGFDKVIDISWWSTFGTQRIWTTIHIEPTSSTV